MSTFARFVVVSFIWLPLTSAAFEPCDSTVTPDTRSEFLFRLLPLKNDIQFVPQSDFEKLESGKLYTHLLDTSFEQYICRDQFGNVAGYDVELIARAVMALKSDFTHIRFVIEPWKQTHIGSVETISLFRRLYEEEGRIQSASAGMSITDDRIKIVDMVGGTYKAGKRLIGWVGNPMLEGKMIGISNLPESDFAVLKGLVTLEEKSSIRGEFWKKLAISEESRGRDYVDIVELKSEEKAGFIKRRNKDRFTVILVDGREEIDEITKSKFAVESNGWGVDFLMIDTGSIESLKYQGYLQTQVGESKDGRDVIDLSGEISQTQLPEVLLTDSGDFKETGKSIGNAAFGLGDGIAFLPMNQHNLFNVYKAILGDKVRANKAVQKVIKGHDRKLAINVAAQIQKFKKAGELDRLIFKYFNDTSASDGKIRVHVGSFCEQLLDGER